jgi:WD40 repeat protein
VFVVPAAGYVTDATANAGLLFDARSLARTATLAHKRPLFLLELTADHRALTVSHDGTAAIWRTDTGARLARLEAAAGAWIDAGFDPSGGRVVTCGQDPEAQIWDARTGARIGALSRHTGFVTSCAYSGDGRLIVTASTDGTARLWDAATLAPLEALPIAAAPDPMLWPHARFQPGGGQLLTSTRTGHVQLWRLGVAAVDPAGLAALARCRSPWRVDRGVLVPGDPLRPGC